jgi:hypothetical protein
MMFRKRKRFHALISSFLEETDISSYDCDSLACLVESVAKSVGFSPKRAVVESLSCTVLKHKYANNQYKHEVVEVDGLVYDLLAKRPFSSHKYLTKTYNNSYDLVLRYR